ncbi:Mitochondrial fission protein [Dissophora globulifera]|uniref:Mitochondrial fission protein n=1 Tax=Dissophora globulifera TaxID=979702 RepID=A0A9P6RSU8_9FUNG|nr:Mitochondrial fission protein [Dissophora globulifera]
MELLHAFDVSDFASSARNTLSTTSSIVFSPLTAQAVKGDLTGIASLTGLSGLAPHLMATQYLRRATANAQALALTGARQATPVPADQLLAEDIPEPAARVSLFQGFRATYPHAKSGKKSKNQHRRRVNGFNEVDGEDPNKAFSSLLSERERTIKEQVKLQTQKAVIQSELGQVAASIDTLIARQTNLGYKLSKLTEREDDLADTLEDLNEKLASISEGTKAEDGEPLQLGYREETRDSGTCMHTFYGHDGIITSLDLNGPYGTMVTASKDNTTRVWDLSTFKCLGQLPGHQDYVECMQLTHNTLVTGSRDSTIRTWNLADINHARTARDGSPTPSDFSSLSDKANGSPSMEEYSRSSVDTLTALDDCWTSTLSGHTGPVTCIYHKDQELISGSNDKTIKEWDMETGQCVLTMDLLWAMGTSNSWSDWMGFDLKDEDFVGDLQSWQYALCSGTIDGALRMWDLRSGQAHRTLVGHTGPVTCLQFDEYHVVSGSRDRSVRIWDLRTGGIQEILQYEDPVNSLRFDTSKIIVGSGESLKIYDRVAQQHSYYTGHTNVVECVRFSDSVLASGGQDSTVRLWSRCNNLVDFAMTQERAPHEIEKSSARSLFHASSPTPSTAATGASLGTRSASSYSLHARTMPVTRLRYRQLVQPLTPTELEPEPKADESSASSTNDTQAYSAGALRFPRVQLSSLDLAKPRIYTRLLYFFETNTSTSSNTSSPGSSSLSPSSPTTVHSSTSGTSAAAPASHKRTGSKVRHHYHYHQSAFMDPMLLQASLALVLTDFFPLAGRICNSDNHSQSNRQYIECNDRGVLFAVADASVSMQQIRRGYYQDAVLPPQLFPVGLYPASLRDPPLFGVQLTYTQDQSLIMGVAVDSSVMDAKSLVSFMDAWAKITQGKDFEPYPILDRTFLEKHGQDYPENGVYRHQRVNNSPPPPILFDNNLDSHLDRGLEETDLQVESDEGDTSESVDLESKDKANSTTAPSSLEQAQSRVQSPHARSSDADTETASLDTVTDTPKDMLDHAEQLGGAVKSTPGSVEDRLDRLHINGISGINTPETETEGGGFHIFHFSPAQLERIKKLASEQNIAAAACAADDKEISDKWVSTGDSLIAYLWKISTITRRLEPDCKLMCGVVMDIRKRLSPVVPDGFIGNAILSISVQMPVHSLLTTPLSLPSRLLRDELLLQTPEQISSSINWIQKQENPHLIETDSNNPFGHDFMVWSLRKLDMYSPDFGQGRPRKVRIGRGGFGGGEGMCIIMDGGPSQHAGEANDVGYSNRTGVDVYLGLQGEHLQDFEKVHRGFMQGLSEPGEDLAGDWECVY